MPTIAVLGTLDTKGHEHAFVEKRIRATGHDTLLIDVGTLGEPTVEPDITRDEVARAGGVDLDALSAAHDRGASVKAMTEAAPAMLAELLDAKRIDGVISLGGGGGTSIATAAMRALPIGFPKVMVSTMASGNTAQYVGVKDIVMIPSIVDVAGLNRVSKLVFTRAADAICGMVGAPVLDASADDERPLIVASQFGNTTDCVNEARRLLEDAGYEVLVFHATGAGGRSMESLIESGMVAGVLDVTTTEWADEVVGGVLTAGPTRLQAAARHGVPAVVAPGCLDMVNFNAPETVPDRFADRLFYEHNPQVTLMRTTADECREIALRIAAKLNASTAPVTVLIPTRAISVISAPGQSFHAPETDAVLFDTLRENLRDGIPVEEHDCEINDPGFAAACVRALLKNMNA
ncbi:MAG: Tm-1-like ATP-binding domain-containing protein [Planctomycetota bacterium]|jgi:uncharacterized protein (UPF0261 family)